MRSWMIGMLAGLLPVLLLPGLPGPWVCSPLIAFALVCLLGAGALPRFCCGLALGLALAIFHGQQLLERRITDVCVGAALGLTGEVSSLPRYTLFADGRSRQRFEFTVEALHPAGCAGPARVLLSYYGPARIVPGDRWMFPVKLSKPWGLANPGSFNLQSWYAQTGIDAVGSVSGGAGTKLTRQGTLASLPNRQRQVISERISALPFEAPVTAILAAVTVADKSGIDTSLWNLFQQFGINHLLVISGLHVGLVAAGAYLLGTLLQRSLLLAGCHVPWIPALLALICCCAYTALAGFSVATQRAMCMVCCFLLASVAGRYSSSGNNLLVAALVVLVINPLAALGSGFWLSFSAVAALLWLARWQRGRPGWLRLLWTHGFMSLVMLPLGAWWFGGSSLVAGAANFIMVPLIGTVVVPAALLAVLAMYLVPAVETPLWYLAAWPLQQVLPVAESLASNTDGWLYRQLPTALPDVALAAAGVLLLILPIPRSARALAAAMVLPLALAPGVAPRSARDDDVAALTSVTVLDVGQGTAVIVRAGDHTLVYDTGGGDPAGANMATSVLLPWLRKSGVAEIDTLIISHPDNDHSAGANTLLAAMDTTQVYYGGSRQALSRGSPCTAGKAWRWPGGQRFQFLSPAGAGGRSRNDDSCVLRIETGGHRLLLPGDVESGRERELVRYWGESLASDWLLVAHHGSRTSSSHALLKTVRPAIAVVSSGYANRFGHPHPDVVGRLRSMGALVLGTATGGALEFEFVPGQPPRFTSHRQRVRRFWM
ncbi:MAG: DNA internalization-related competence protein ComEC/Rec2 [Halioglobus sp.]|nr:DNA internalization-related competence protein ComEC/Rec2 [Halioglobus sp.]